MSHHSSPSSTRERYLALPKAHLHLHLEGALRPSTVAEFAGRDGLQIPRLGPYDGLSGFVEDYEVVRALVGSLADLKRVAKEVVEDAAAQGVWWLEAHLTPLNYEGRLGTGEAIVETVLEGFADAAGRTGTEATVILAHNRGRPPDRARATLELARKYSGHGVVGFGLVGDENVPPAAEYTNVFREATAFGLSCVPHAGEVCGPSSVWYAVSDLQASRIGHGIRAVEDPDLLKCLADKQICLDVCPSSNVQLSATSALGEHPLPELLGAGVAVSIGSDNPLFFGVDLVDEYIRAGSMMGLVDSHLAKIATDSFQHSSAPEDLKVRAMQVISSWLEAAAAPIDAGHPEVAGASGRCSGGNRS